MRLATFDIDSELAARLSNDEIRTVPCRPPPDAGLAHSLEAGEAELAASDASAALIAGDGDWALGAALACAKALVPFAYLRGAGGTVGPHGGHVERLAERVIEPGPGTTAAVQAWATDSTPS